MAIRGGHLCVTMLMARPAEVRFTAVNLPEGQDAADGPSSLSWEVAELAEVLVTDAGVLRTGIVLRHRTVTERGSQDHQVDGLLPSKVILFRCAWRRAANAFEPVSTAVLQDALEFRRVLRQNHFIRLSHDERVLFKFPTVFDWYADST